MAGCACVAGKSRGLQAAKARRKTSYSIPATQYPLVQGISITLPETDRFVRVNVVRSNASPQTVTFCPHICPVLLVTKQVFNHHHARPVHLKIQTFENLQLPPFDIHRQNINMFDVRSMCSQNRVETSQIHFYFTNVQVGAETRVRVLDSKGGK